MGRVVARDLHGRDRRRAGRVATSLLHAVGLPELATDSLAEYEALALQFATDAAQLRRVRERLAHSRSSCRLFDTDTFRRRLESAYLRMWEVHRSGRPPQSFAVDA